MLTSKTKFLTTFDIITPKFWPYKPKTLNWKIKHLNFDQFWPLNQLTKSLTTKVLTNFVLNQFFKTNFDLTKPKFSKEKLTFLRKKIAQFINELPDWLKPPCLAHCASSDSSVRNSPSLERRSAVWCSTFRSRVPADVFRPKSATAAPVNTEKIDDHFSDYHQQ